MYAEVLVELKIKNIDNTFTYLIPPNLVNDVELGKRVLVPFGHQKVEGFVLRIDEIRELDYKAKKIIEVIDDKPVLNKELLELGKYISKKTLCNLISAYQTMLPTALKAKHKVKINKKYETYIKLNRNIDISVNGSKQKKILEYLEDKELVLKKELTKISASSVKSLIDKNILIEEKYEKYRLDNNYHKEDSDIILNEEQTIAFNKIKNNLNQFKPFLLYGVTGSGKTEVYMHAIKEVIKQGKEVIVLVPEISLTPQMVSLFRKRFGSIVAILHSGLSNGEKYDEWRKIEEKKVSIVIGARSAIFAPLTNIGMIIVDEEQTDSYKQENHPRYHAIDVAIHRAKYYNCPIVLGSATPSIESFTRAKLGVYELLTLKKRVNDNMPIVKLIDYKDMMRTKDKIISTELKEKIQDRLDINEQIIILLNRRGYNTVISCKECGYVHKCPRCDIPLTYHKKTNSMKCHYCDYVTSKLNKCPKCNSTNINSYGIGTEKLESIIKEMYPSARVARMDVDTTRNKGSHERILKSFRNHEYDILIGTQMIAKGLDFEDVTLVGVLNGDASLNIPDFRSSERTFQLLNQVSGRAGRGSKKGEVIIQSFNVEHYSIVLATKHDYDTFYKKELALRKKLKYPPYINLLLIRLSGKNYDTLNDEGYKIVNFLNSKLKNKNVIILGPSSANQAKINNIYYINIILKYKNTKNIIDYVKYINDKYKSNRKINVEVDINPIHM